MTKLLIALQPYIRCFWFIAISEVIGYFGAIVLRGTVSQTICFWFAYMVLVGIDEFLAHRKNRATPEQQPDA
jgi:uncharacterized membrane protein